MIADNFKVLFVRTGSFYPNKHFQYNFYSYSNDVELAKNIYFLTVKIIQYRTKKYLKTCASINRKLTAFLKRNYIHGFIPGLAIRLNDQTKKYDLMVKPDGYNTDLSQRSVSIG